VQPYHESRPKGFSSGARISTPLNNCKRTNEGKDGSCLASVQPLAAGHAGFERKNAMITNHLVGLAHFARSLAMDMVQSQLGWIVQRIRKQRLRE
jgi:hypothetical protein